MTHGPLLPLVVVQFVSIVLLEPLVFLLAHIPPVTGITTGFLVMANRAGILVTEGFKQRNIRQWLKR